jgi:hypothetical protein
MIRLNVNGQERDIDVDPGTPLLYGLRDDLQLNGATFGCGLGQRGACTVLAEARRFSRASCPRLPCRGGGCERWKAWARRKRLGRCSEPSSKSRPHIQSLSWTLFEAVKFDRVRITSLDRGGYPILSFSDVPDSIEVHVINRPGEPYLGTGECVQGPAAGAIANAVADATGVRLRELPLTAAHVKAAIGI